MGEAGAWRWGRHPQTPSNLCPLSTHSPTACQHGSPMSTVAGGIQRHDQAPGTLHTRSCPGCALHWAPEATYSNVGAGNNPQGQAGS